jgi:hypothetical protein
MEQPVIHNATETLNGEKVLLEKLLVTQLVKKLPTFYGNQWFITMFRRAALQGPM